MGRKCRLLLTLVLVMVSLAMARPAVAQNWYNLNFIAYEQQSGEPLCGARVEISIDFGNGWNRTTDCGGFANFGVIEGPIDFCMYANGYFTYCGSNYVDHDTTIWIPMNRVWHNLNFVTRDLFSGASICSAYVQINIDFGNGTTRSTDCNGIANFGVTESWIYYTISANGYDSTSEWVYVNNHTTLYLSLNPSDPSIPISNEETPGDPNIEQNGDDSGGLFETSVHFDARDINGAQAVPLPPPPQNFVSTDSTTKLYLYAWPGVPGVGQPLPFRILDITATHNAPGHDHSSANVSLGNFTGSCNTGSDGRACVITFKSNKIAASVTFSATDRLSGRLYYRLLIVNVGGNQGYDFPTKLDNYLPSSDFVLIGQTSTHQNNHYCAAITCTRLVQLAADYRARFPGLRLAYNDIALIKGGLFDISANWNTPHQTHRTGTNVDIRTNGGPDSVPYPNNSPQRTWLRNRIFQLFGRFPQYDNLNRAGIIGGRLT